MMNSNQEAGNNEVSQYSTFVVAGRLYGIDVTRVQEVVRPLQMTPIPLAASYIGGLINLRGQVATAVSLRELFALGAKRSEASMNVVCTCNGNLFSLLVDEIGDVVEVSRAEFEQTPNTIPEDIRRFMSGVYKTSDQLLSIIEVGRIAEFLDQ